MKTFYPNIVEYTSFSNTLRNFIKIDYVLGHKINFNTFKRLVIATSLILMKLRKKIRKKYIYWKH